MEWVRLPVATVASTLTATGRALSVLVFSCLFVFWSEASVLLASFVLPSSPSHLHCVGVQFQYRLSCTSFYSRASLSVHLYLALFPRFQSWCRDSRLWVTTACVGIGGTQLL